MSAPLVLEFSVAEGISYEVTVNDTCKGDGEVYSRHEDYLYLMKGWRFEDFDGTRFEVIYAPDYRCSYVAFLQRWEQRTISRVESKHERATA